MPLHGNGVTLLLSSPVCPFPSTVQTVGVLHFQSVASGKRHGRSAKESSLYRKLVLLFRLTFLLEAPFAQTRHPSPGNPRATHVPKQKDLKGVQVVRGNIGKELVPAAVVFAHSLKLFACSESHVRNSLDRSSDCTSLVIFVYSVRVKLLCLEG